MSSKKKLVISLSVAAAVLVAAIIAIVAVFAAAQQTVQSSFTIKFTATDVDCTVSGTWALATPAEGESGSLGTVVIAARDGKGTHSMDASPVIALSSAKNYVDLTYTFTNSGSRAFTIKSTKAEVGEKLSLVFLDGEKESIDDVIADTGVTCQTTAVIIVRITFDENAFNEDFTSDPITISWDLAAVAA